MKLDIQQQTFQNRKKNKTSVVFAGFHIVSS